MAFKKRNIRKMVDAPYSATGFIQHWAYADTDAIATMLAAGYFNDMRDRFRSNDILHLSGASDTTGDHVVARVTTAPATGDVLVVTEDDQKSVGSARAVVPTADGLTTGLILAGDSFVALASAGANDIATLPAIASVPLGKEIWAKNGGTACELRTPATSTTKINNGQADANEAVIAANTSVFIKKTAADNWLVLTYVGGAVACPIPD